MWSLLRGHSVSNPPSWLTALSLMESLGCTEKELMEEYTSGMIEKCLAFFNIRKQVEELAERDAKARSAVHIPHIPSRR